VKWLRLALRFRRPDPSDPAVEVEVALIRDWRKLLAVEATDEGNWWADLTGSPTRFWEDGWQAVPAPAAATTPKLIPVITTGHGREAVELAQTYFRRWNCQENAIRDCAPLRREIGYLPQAGEVESETSRTTPDPTRKLGKGH
jgi:hypothetical protein